MFFLYLSFRITEQSKTPRKRAYRIAIDLNFDLKKNPDKKYFFIMEKNDFEKKYFRFFRKFSKIFMTKKSISLSKFSIFKNRKFT